MLALSGWPRAISVNQTQCISVNQTQWGTGPGRGAARAFVTHCQPGLIPKLLWSIIGNNEPILPIIDLVMIGNNETIFTVIIGNNETVNWSVIISNNDAITEVIIGVSARCSGKVYHS